MSLKKYSAGNNIFLVVVAIMILAGCGLKANPVPVKSAADKTKDVVVLSATIQDGAVVLTWTLPRRSYSHVKVEKSELGETGSICKDCPLAYKGVAELTVKNEARYADRAVVKGKSYSYRLNICEEHGECRLSQQIQVDLK